MARTYYGSSGKKGSPLMVVGAAVAVLALAHSATGGTGAVTMSAVPAAGSYGPSSLERLWEQAGGSSSTAYNAACHAMQESSGNPVVTSSNPDGGTNVGLWQLDTNGVGSGHSVSELSDPLTNAKITVAATNDGANWASWATPGC